MPKQKKLTYAQVHDLREWWNNLASPITQSSRGENTISFMARKYGVSRQAVTYVVHGKTWRDALATKAGAA